MNKIADGMLAAMILIVSCRSGTRYHNNTPYLSKITLPDGSNVTMKSGATILIAHDFRKSNRQVDFDGEGLFEVVTAGGQPFIVHTRALLIEVLGTRFRVDASRKDPGEEVDLFNGKLRVMKAYHSDLDNDTLFLNSGDRFMINTDIDLMQSDTMSPEEIKKAEKFH